MSVSLGSKQLGEQVWDRYELDVQASPVPWLGGEEAFQSFLLMEILPCTFPEQTWLTGPLLHDYRWRVSFWHDRQHRLSADIFLPLASSVRPRPPISTLAAMASSASAPPAPVLEEEEDAAGCVYALHFDWLERSQQRELNYRTASAVPGPSGMYMIVELVHRLSGVPLSRGSIRVTPQHATRGRGSVVIGPSNAIALDMSTCYDLGLATSALPNRQQHGEPLVRTQDLPKYNCVLSFMRAPSSAPHWKLNRPLVLLPAFIPSPREVLCTNDQAGLDRRPAPHGLDSLARPCRCFVSVHELQIAPDLLELCSSDRIVATAHSLGGDKEPGPNPFAALTPSFLGEMSSNQEASWCTASEVLLPPRTSSLTRIKVDIVGFTIGPDAAFGGGRSGSFQQQAMELCCGVLTPSCRRLPTSPSSSQLVQQQYGHEEDKGLDADTADDAEPAPLEPGHYEVPLFAHPTVVVCGYRNMDEAEPEGIFVGRIVVHVTLLADGGEAARDVADMDPYLFPTIRSFGAAAPKVAHAQPTSLASNICDHIISSLLSPDPLPIWMVHADAGDDMGRRNVYDRLGLFDAVSCLSACARRISSQSSGLARSMLSPGTMQAGATQADGVASLSVVGHLVGRLSQPGVCDAAALCALAALIDKAGASHALWCLFQQWTSSAQQLIAVGQEARKGPGKDGPSALHIPSDDDFQRARAACWCFRVLGYSQHVERIRGLPIAMARASRETNSVTTASLAEDLMHILLGFAAPTVRHLVADYAVCVEHAQQHRTGSSGTETDGGGGRAGLVTVELEKQRCLCMQVVAGMLAAVLESVSLLLPVVGGLGTEMARAVGELVQAVMRVPFAPVTVVGEATAAAAHAGCETVALLASFLSLLLRQQPSGLDLFPEPAPYVWTKTWMGQASAPRSQQFNVSTGQPLRRADPKAEASVARILSDSIRHVADFVSANAAVLRVPGGLMGGSLTLALRDLYASIDRSLAQRVVPRDSLSVLEPSSQAAPLVALPPAVRRKRGAGVAATGAAIASKGDINDVYAQHRAFIGQEGHAAIRGLGQTVNLGMRSPVAAPAARGLAGTLSVGAGSDRSKAVGEPPAPVTVTAVRSLMENGSLQVRAGSFALEGEEAVVYIGERAPFLDCLLALAVAVGALSEIPCDVRLGLGGALSAFPARRMVSFVLDSILKRSPGAAQGEHGHEARMAAALESLSQSRGPPGSYFVLLAIHLADVVDLHWRAASALTQGIASATPSLHAAPHALCARMMHFDRAQLPVQLARDVELLTQAARTLFARVHVDEALSIAEVRAFASAHKHRAAATQAGRVVVDERLLLSGGDVCAISSWLRLRRHLVDAVVGVLRAGIRLGLFDADAVLAQTAAEARAQLSASLNLPADAPTGRRQAPQHATSHGAFAQRIQALSSLADISSQTPTRHVPAAAFSGTPLNCLVWLLRDLADLEPLQQSRSDLAVLCLSSDDDAKRTLTTLLSIAIDLPVLPEGGVSSMGAIAKVLNLAREDLLGGCVNIMQLLSPGLHASPLTLEPYFQAVLDECVGQCVPAAMRPQLEPALSLLLKSSEPIEPCLVRPSTRGFAATVSALLRLLAAPEPMRSKALWRMRERLMRRLSAVRTLVLARAAASVPQPRSADACEHSLRKGFSLVACGAALQTLLHMAPRQKGRGGWGLDLRDRRALLQELNDLTPGSSQWLRSHTHGADKPPGSSSPTRSVLDHGNPFRVSEKHGQEEEEEEDVFDPLRNLGVGHRAGQAMLELSIGEAIAADDSGGQGAACEYGEEEHRRGRAALGHLLHVGEWETGVTVALSLGEQCRRTHARIAEALSAAQAASTAALSGAPSSGAQHVHALKMRLHRQAALTLELSRAHEKLQQRLVHDGPLRPLPIYYALRFLENPWVQAEVDEGLRCFLDATDCRLAGYAVRASGAEGAHGHAHKRGKQSKRASHVDDEDQQGRPREEELAPAPDGLGRGMWVLLRCDPTAFARNASVYADMADAATVRLLRRKRRAEGCNESDASEEDEEEDGEDRVPVPLPSTCSLAIQAQLLRAFPSYQVRQRPSSPTHRTAPAPPTPSPPALS